MSFTYESHARDLIRIFSSAIQDAATRTSTLMILWRGGEGSLSVVSIASGSLVMIRSTKLGPLMGTSTPITLHQKPQAFYVGHRMVS
jgi:hypothetical protein